MERTLEFRRQLAARLIQAAALSLPTVALIAVSCGSQTEGGGQTDSTTSATGSSSTTDPTGGDGSYTAEDCFAWPMGMGGAGGAGGAGGKGIGGAGGASGVAGASNAGGMGGAGSVMCPSPEEASGYITTNCGGQVQTNGTLKDGKCCYTVVHYGCLTGRPFLIGDGALAAAPRRSQGGAEPGREAWTDPGLLVPSLNDLTSEERARLAQAWTNDGLFEHASIASFGRFALELMAVGAPADLVELTHSAAIDEIRHAKLSLALASAYAGEAIRPSSFPFGGRVDVSDDLADIAARAAMEGCVGETVAAIQAAEQAARATDPAARAALSTIAPDEARHAELAWRSVAWAISVGGDRVRVAVAAAIERAIKDVLENAPQVGEVGEVGEVGKASSDRLEAHGLLSAETRRSIAERAISDVIRPAAIALLSASAVASDPRERAADA